MAHIVILCPVLRGLCFMVQSRAWQAQKNVNVCSSFRPDELSPNP